MQENIFHDILPEKQEVDTFAEMFASADPVSFLTERYLAAHNEMEEITALMAPLKRRMEEQKGMVLWLESAARALYERVGIDHAERGPVIMTVKPSTATMVDDESEVPDDFKKKQPDVLDISKIRFALMRGEAVPGARLSDQQSVKFKIRDE